LQVSGNVEVSLQINFVCDCFFNKKFKKPLTLPLIHW